MTERILIVDDERLTRVTLEARLADEGYQVATAQNPYEALEILEQGAVHAIITDLRMPSMNGLELLRRVRSAWPDTPVLFMTAFGTVESAVDAMREGAFDYLTKPLNTDELLIRIRRALGHRRDVEEIRRLRREAQRWNRTAGMVYRSEVMKQVAERALAVADSDMTVLIQGETGTGKEVLARLIHEHSPRRDGPLVVVNCGGLNPNLVESELFGHEAGAFTGAQRQRIGRLELARGGTILVDEVDDLSPEIQLRLLRFLQDHTFERVGGNDTIRADVRVLCATKKSLEELMRAGRFRDDLYYRINTVMIDLPPLRERREDVLALADHFVTELHGDGATDPDPRFTSTARAALLAYDWPGNVRELQHTIEHGVMFARGRSIDREHLPRRIAEADAPRVVQLNLAGRDAINFPKVLAACEQQLVDWALLRAGGNQGRAAELLGLSRTTFRGRLEAVRQRAAEPDDGPDEI